MISYLDFEKPVAQLDERISRNCAQQRKSDEVDIAAELKRLGDEKRRFARKQPMRRLRLGRRHRSPDIRKRPHFRDFVEHAFEEFVPLGGDRLLWR